MVYEKFLDEIAHSIDKAVTENKEILIGGYNINFLNHKEKLNLETVMSL